MREDGIHVPDFVAFINKEFSSNKQNAFHEAVQNGKLHCITYTSVDVFFKVV
jgi:hypothetical protein